MKQVPEVQIKEFEFLDHFAREGFLDEELVRDQLRALWTAYCFHANLDVDTGKYDSELSTLWETICEQGECDTADWSDFDSFDLFMGELLC